MKASVSSIGVHKDYWVTRKKKNYKEMPQFHCEKSVQTYDMKSNLRAIMVIPN